MSIISTKLPFCTVHLLSDSKQKRYDLEEVPDCFVPIEVTLTDNSPAYRTKAHFSFTDQDFGQWKKASPERRLQLMALLFGAIDYQIGSEQFLSALGNPKTLQPVLNPHTKAAIADIAMRQCNVVWPTIRFIPDEAGNERAEPALLVGLGRGIVVTTHPVELKAQSVLAMFGLVGDEKFESIVGEIGLFGKRQVVHVYRIYNNSLFLENVDVRALLEQTDVKMDAYKGLIDALGGYTDLMLSSANAATFEAKQ